MRKRSLTGRTSHAAIERCYASWSRGRRRRPRLVAAPFVRSANAAGSLTIGLWDHWVPGANDVQSAIIKEWADKEKVDVKVDYITSQGNKLLLTLSVEAQAHSGHDIMEFTNWESAQFNAGARAGRRRRQAGRRHRTARSIRRSSISASTRAAGSACR